MIDDATSRAWGQFVMHDTTEHNMRVLWRYLEQYGRPLAFYTDKAAIFETARKQHNNDCDPEQDRTQMTRALAEIGIERISAHSPQAKGRVGRFFGTAQDRLIKGLRLAGISTLDEANAYLETEYLPEWNRLRTVAPVNATDAHRPLYELTKLHASLSHVEKRKVTNNYTFPLSGQTYKIADEHSAWTEGQFHSCRSAFGWNRRRTLRQPVSGNQRLPCRATRPRLAIERRSQRPQSERT